MAKRKLGRRTAGRQLSGLAGALSEDLLLHEEQCKLNMEEAFSAYLPSVADTLGSNLSPAKKGEVLTGMAELAIDDSTPMYGTLAIAALQLGVDSIRHELLICEATLGAKYEGVTAEAVDQVVSYSTRLASRSLEVYRENVKLILPWFREQVATELTISNAREEDWDLLVDRLVSPTPLRNAAGHAGRGLWWKILERCNRITRETEFAVVNSARSDAMIRFNDIAGRR